MTDTQQSMTSLSLLASLRETGNQQGWDEFVKRYQPKIEGWCRRWGLKEADTDDVAQNVLLQISKQMKQFEYDPSGRFRSWLKTVARRAWVDFLKSSERNHAQPGSSDPLQQLHSVQARDDLMKDLQEEADRELLEAAMRNVQPRLKPHTWEAFRLMTFENLSGAEVGRQLEISEAGVFVARGRVQKMILEEVKRLDRIHEDLPAG